MGQCYTVVVVFKDERDKEPFARSALETIMEYSRNGLARFDFDRGNILNDNGEFQPFVVFKYLTASNAEDWGTSWEADFDASYGWESVLYNCLKSGLEGRTEGTAVSIGVDLDWDWEARVTDGRIVVKINGKECEEEEA